MKSTKNTPTELVTEIAICWTAQDALERLKETEREHIYSPELASAVLIAMYEHYDANSGITWDTMDFCIEEYLNEQAEQKSSLEVAPELQSSDLKTEYVVRFDAEMIRNRMESTGMAHAYTPELADSVLRSIEQAHQALMRHSDTLFNVWDAIDNYIKQNCDTQMLELANHLRTACTLLWKHGILLYVDFDGFNKPLLYLIDLMRMYGKDNFNGQIAVAYWYEINGGTLHYGLSKPDVLPSLGTTAHEFVSDFVQRYENGILEHQAAKCLLATQDLFAWDDVHKDGNYVWNQEADYPQMWVWKKGKDVEGDDCLVPHLRIDSKEFRSFMYNLQF